MTEEQCVQFLKALRAKNIHVKDNGWVAASCVLAKWTHKNHSDSSPSFGLKVAPGERSYFLCFACRQGSAEELLSSIEMHSHQSTEYDFALAHQLLQDEEYVIPLPEYGEFAHAGQVFDAWPHYWLDSFPKAEWAAESAAYLAGRGVPLAVVQQHDLRFDTKRRMVVAPYWDVFGRLAGARGRSVDDTAKMKHYDYSWQGKNNARLVWFHEPVLNMPGPVVVVEGQFDLMKVCQVFPKVVANLTAKPTFEKMKKLSDSSTVVQIPDRDEAGDQSIQVYAKYCHQLGLKHQVVHLDEGCKDPGDCNPEYLRDKIAEVL